MSFFSNIGNALSSGLSAIGNFFTGNLGNGGSSQMANVGSTVPTLNTPTPSINASTISPESTVPNASLVGGGTARFSGIGGNATETRNTPSGAVTTAARPSAVIPPFSPVMPTPTNNAGGYGGSPYGPPAPAFTPMVRTTPTYSGGGGGGGGYTATPAPTGTSGTSSNAANSSGSSGGGGGGGGGLNFNYSGNTGTSGTGTSSGTGFSSVGAVGSIAPQVIYDTSDQSKYRQVSVPGVGTRFSDANGNLYIPRTDQNGNVSYTLDTMTPKGNYGFADQNAAPSYNPPAPTSTAGMFPSNPVPGQQISYQGNTYQYGNAGQTGWVDQNGKSFTPPQTATYGNQPAQTNTVTNNGQPGGIGFNPPENTIPSSNPITSPGAPGVANNPFLSSQFNAGNPPSETDIKNMSDQVAQWEEQLSSGQLSGQDKATIYSQLNGAIPILKQWSAQLDGTSALTKGSPTTASQTTAINNDPTGTLQQQMDSFKASLPFNWTDPSTGKSYTGYDAAMYQYLNAQNEINALNMQRSLLSSSLSSGTLPQGAREARLSEFDSINNAKILELQQEAQLAGATVDKFNTMINQQFNISSTQADISLRQQGLQLQALNTMNSTGALAQAAQDPAAMAALEQQLGMTDPAQQQAFGEYVKGAYRNKQLENTSFSANTTNGHLYAVVHNPDGTFTPHDLGSITTINPSQAIQAATYSYGTGGEQVFGGTTGNAPGGRTYGLPPQSPIPGGNAGSTTSTAPAPQQNNGFPTGMKSTFTRKDGIEQPYSGHTMIQLPDGQIIDIPYFDATRLGPNGDALRGVTPSNVAATATADDSAVFSKAIGGEDNLLAAAGLLQESKSNPAGAISRLGALVSQPISNFFQSDASLYAITQILADTAVKNAMATSGLTPGRVGGDVLKTVNALNASPTPQDTQAVAKMKVGDLLTLMDAAKAGALHIEYNR